MGNMTLSMPDSIQEEMKQFAEVKWSEVARRAIVTKLETLKVVEKIAAKSKLALSDVDAIAEKIDRAVSKRLGLR